MIRPSLPQELVEMIFTWARLEPHKEIADFKTLAASSRVCKAWQAPAQGLLFRDIPISLCHRHRSLLIRTLSDRPDLGRHIRSFGMEITSPPVPWGRNPPKSSSKRYRRTVADFISILTHAPNLTRLSIDIDGEFDVADVSKFWSINLHHIQVLNWEGRPTSSALYLFLALWPSIRYLRIDNLFLDPLPEDRRPLSLRSLSMRDELSENFMTWLLPTPTDDGEPLRELHLECGLPSYGTLKDLQAHAHNLHVLTMDKIPPQSFLDALTVLKEFTFCELPRAPLQLPRSVQQVRCHAKRERPFYLIADGPLPRPLITPVESDESRISNETGYLTKALRELPNLVAVGATCQAPEKVLASLDKFCSEAFVEFVIYDSSAIFSPWRSLI
ncbi:hypothetical protein BJV78DRAFT_161078 [Lactifluus subvellereus]|nr:hypothetical protein BJV78DRAFT_161078 [Lactifluus subvellereus]